MDKKANISPVTCPRCGTVNAPGTRACAGCSITFEIREVPVAIEGEEPTEIEELRAQTEAEEIRERVPTFQQHKAVKPGSGAAPSLAPEIPPGAPSIRIGYDKDNDLVIPLPQVSGRHAELAAVGERYVIKDAGSTNGVYVNGHRVERAYVRLGENIGLGSYEFPLTTQITQKLAEQSAVEKATQAISVPQSFAKVLVIGRDPDCDVVVDAPQISRRHAELQWTGRGWRVTDLGTVNGTFVNDRNRPANNTSVAANDVLFFGSYRFPVSRLSRFITTEQEAVGGKLEIPPGKMVITIGRGPNNDVVLDVPQISRQHARLTRTAHGYLVEDLGTANGTYVDGVAIKKSEVKPGQTVSFGSYAVQFDSAGAMQRQQPDDIALEVSGVSVSARNGTQRKTLLDDVSFTAYPTEIVGILGPSGSGKTTLLMSIIGDLRPDRGATRLNGLDLRRHFAQFRGAIGYLPQDDIIHPQLTVWESLYYAARLRLPPDTSKREINRRIDAVLADLEIDEIKNVPIGSPETKKGISGGQRKRVNLAMELLTEPHLLCLDEPTTGLASEDALNVMQILRRLADDGRTILLTIHQPSLRAYRVMDNALYIADGNLVYYGPSFPDSMLFFHPDIQQGTPDAEEIMSDPGSCMTPVVHASRSDNVNRLVDRFRSSDYHEEYVVRRARSKTDNVTRSKKRRGRRFGVRQFFTLVARSFRTRIRDRIGTGVLLLQAPIIAILLDLVFAAENIGVKERMTDSPFALFLLVISAIWFGCSNAAREIVEERPIFHRERMVNLSIPAYVASKFLVLSTICFAQCLVLIGFTYFVLGFMGNFFFHLVLLWFCSIAGVGMGLVLSSVVRSVDAATASVPILLIPQIILGGAIMPIDRMNLPTEISTYAVVSRWGFEGELQAEYMADAYEIAPEDLPKPPLPGLPSPDPPPNPLERFFGDAESVGISVPIAVLFVFNFLSFFVVCALLYLSDRRRRS